eukprot:TRINITY_DN5529_c0_g2_i1.p1 TRINITY_DN5529_c0_g2~~TRINITY_DN5529_c0_g2_i1.p1  ORF type:complete len:812 (-),score=190.81 TRINITY_DN5529_c0_g2_i1:122-2464(-)
MSEGNVHLFLSLGLTEKVAVDTNKNAKLSAELLEVIKEAGVGGGCDKIVGNVLYNVAAKFPPNALRHRAYVSQLVAQRKITAGNVQHAFDYLKKIGHEDLDKEAFERECGVGIVVTLEEISSTIHRFLSEPARLAELNAKRYHTNIGSLLGQLKGANVNIRWADGKELLDELNRQVQAILGPRTAADDVEPPKKAAAAPSENKEKAAANKAPTEVEPPAVEEPRFPDPSENIQNTHELLREHLAATGGLVYTRFPPEPNGYLHIGHAKAMHLVFGYANQLNGKCYLRFDDTNPEKENQEYIDNIIENVNWMGHKPWKVTYSSHYFPKLYELGVELIKRGKAYVDHQTPEEIKESRRTKQESPYRNRPIEENLRLFEDMRKGKFEEGAATLRMKADMQSNNPNMRDLVAFRIKFHPHPISGDQWCVYPSYDFTHCLVDSLENITHSLCTLEFESRRESYNWLIDVLGMYRPVVWEYARLQLTYTLLSKRKLIQLVNGGYVRGWDDPRMPTITGYRRRGYTPESINNFCKLIGVTRTNSVLPHSLLEESLRTDLNVKALRRFCVLNPLKITITNWPENEVEWKDVINHPLDPSKGTRKVPLSRTVYIEQSDFRLVDEKDYYGLAPGKEVLLKYSYNIRCVDVVKDKETGKPIELLCTVDKNNTNKLKGVIHWVAEVPGTPVLPVELRLYDYMFKSTQPWELADDWISDLRKDSEIIIKGIAEPELKNVKPNEKFQFERVGYFCVDLDTNAEKGLIVFNRSVSLKESKEKPTEKPKQGPSKSK